MIETTSIIIIWWFGAVLAVAALAFTTYVLLLFARAVSEKLSGQLMRIVRISTARYWVTRMEREGLTIGLTDYRKLVAERSPKTVDDFEKVEAEWHRRDKA